MTTISETGQTEYVIPMDRPERAKGLILQMLSEMGSGAKDILNTFGATGGGGGGFGGISQRLAMAGAYPSGGGGSVKSNSDNTVTSNPVINVRIKRSRHDREGGLPGVRANADASCEGGARLMNRPIQMVHIMEGGTAYSFDCVIKSEHSHTMDVLEDIKEAKNKIHTNYAVIKPSTLMLEVSVNDTVTVSGEPDKRWKLKK